MLLYSIILYKNGKVIECYHTSSQPIVEGDSITWNYGLDRLSGINVDYIVVEGEFSFQKGGSLPQEVIDQDIKNELLPEIERLKQELEALKQSSS
jgi:hypothetical protein